MLGWEIFFFQQQSISISALFVNFFTVSFTRQDEILSFIFSAQLCARERSHRCWGGMKTTVLHSIPEIYILFHATPGEPSIHI